MQTRISEPIQRRRPAKSIDLRRLAQIVSGSFLILVVFVGKCGVPNNILGNSACSELKNQPEVARTSARTMPSGAGVTAATAPGNATAAPAAVPVASRKAATCSASPTLPAVQAATGTNARAAQAAAVQVSSIKSERLSGGDRAGSTWVGKPR